VFQTVNFPLQHIHLPPSVDYVPSFLSAFRDYVPTVSERAHPSPGVVRMSPGMADTDWGREGPNGCHRCPL